MEQRFSCSPGEKANRGTTGSKQARFRALSCALAWLEFRGKFLGNTQWRWTAKAPSPGCFQSPITDTLQSSVMFLVFDSALLIKGWLMGRKGNILPACLFPLDYGCIFSVVEKYLRSCLAKWLCGLGLGRNKSQPKKEKDCKCVLLSTEPSFHCQLAQCVKIWLKFYFFWEAPFFYPKSLPRTTCFSLLLLHLPHCIINAIFPGGSVVKNLPASAGDVGSVPGSGRSLAEDDGNRIQYPCLEKSHGQRSLVGYSPWGRKELDMTEGLNHKYQCQFAWQSLPLTELIEDRNSWIMAIDSISPALNSGLL